MTSAAGRMRPRTKLRPMRSRPGKACRPPQAMLILSIFIRRTGSAISAEANSFTAFRTQAGSGMRGRVPIEPTVAPVPEA